MMWGDALPASYDNWRMSGPDEYDDYDEDDYDEDDDRACAPCPLCGEDRVDWLLIPEWDDNAVHCETCGLWYKLEG